MASGLGYLALAWWFPLRQQYDRVPPADLRTFAPGLAGGLVYALLLVALFWLLVLAFGRLLNRGADDFVHRSRRPLVMILLVSLLLGLPLLLAYPYNAIDVYTYYLQGRVSVLYGANPYTTPPTAFPFDTTALLADEWAGETAPYGPIWVFLSTRLVALVDADLLLSLFLLKVAGLVFFLLTTWVLGLVLARHAASQDRWALLSLWAWNPALLLVFVANAHNDALMIALLLAGYGLMRRGRPTAAILLTILAALTKPIALLALPFFALVAWRDNPWKKRLAIALGAAAGSIVLVILAFLPWIQPAAPWVTPLSLLARLGREATGNAGFSLPVMVWFSGKGLGLDPPLPLLGAAFTALFLVCLGWLIWRVWRGRGLSWGLGRVFGSYLLQAQSFRVWYASWVFPWLLMDMAETETSPDARTAYWFRVGFWFLLTTQLSAVIYGHIRVWLLGGQHLLAHLIAVPFTFGLPLVLARREWPATRPVMRADQGPPETALT